MPLSQRSTSHGPAHGRFDCRPRHTASSPSRSTVRSSTELDTAGRVTRDGVAITDEMLVGLAAVRALASSSYLNATFAGDELVVHRSVNLGLVRAVADDGMLVPGGARRRRSDACAHSRVGSGNSTSASPRGT